MDATWDAESYYWNYFMRSNANFGGHSRDREYTTSEFNNKHPMSSVDFDMDSYSGDIEDPDGKPRHQHQLQLQHQLLHQRLQEKLLQSRYGK